MSKFYDISARITNELPTIKITEDLICTVNNRKNTILNVQAMLEEKDRNKDENGQDDSKEEFENMQKALAMILGEKHAKAIDELNLPVNEYTDLFRAVFAVAQGKDPDEEFKDTP